MQIIYTISFIATTMIFTSEFTEDESLVLAGILTTIYSFIFNEMTKKKINERLHEANRVFDKLEIASKEMKKQSQKRIDKLKKENEKS